MSGDKDRDKTEKPTGRRLEKAKNEGTIAKSLEIPSALILLSGLIVFFFSGPYMFSNMTEFMSFVFKGIGKDDIDIVAMQTFLFQVLHHILSIIMPLMISILIAGVAGHILQFGFIFITKPFEPKFSKMNPVNGIKNVFSIKSFVEVIKAFFKICFIGGITYYFINDEIDFLPHLMRMGINDICKYIGEISLKIGFYVCLSLAALAIIDFIYQRWQHQKDLMMTKQEIKDEAKQSEGDPKIKGRIKQIQLEYSRRRMMDHVHEGDVVITNPTSLAIVLKYDAEKMLAPTVIAKGAGFIAGKIREIAKLHNIPIIENKPLAQTIFKTVGINEYVPATLYRAVAQILAYVYKLKRKV